MNAKKKKLNDINCINERLNMLESKIEYISETKKQNEEFDFSLLSISDKTKNYLNENKIKTLSDLQKINIFQLVRKNQIHISVAKELIVKFKQ